MWSETWVLKTNYIHHKLNYNVLLKDAQGAQDRNMSQDIHNEFSGLNISEPTKV